MDKKQEREFDEIFESLRIRLAKLVDYTNTHKKDTLYDF